MAGEESYQENQETENNDLESAETKPSRRSEREAQACLAKKLLMFTAALTLLAIGIAIPTIMLMECKNPSDDPTVPTPPTVPPLPDATGLPDVTDLPETEHPIENTDVSDTTGYFTTGYFITGYFTENTTI